MDTTNKVQILDETAFYIVLILLEKVWIQLFSLLLRENNRETWAFVTLVYNLMGKRKTLYLNKLNFA